MKRRAALQLLAAFGAGTAVPPGVLEQVLSGVEEALGNPLDIDEWERVVHEYAQRIVMRPAGSLVPQMTADIIAVGELLKGQHSASARAGLLRASGGLSALLAIELDDVGDERAARVTWNTAKRAADASGDRDLRVWIRGRAAKDACWTQRPSRVVTDLTDEAIQIAAGSPSPGLANAHAARAFLAARQGDKPQANASLGEAKRTYDRLMHNTGEHSVLVFRETHLRWAESYVHAMIGDKRAEAALSRAFTLYPPDAHGPITNLELMESAMLVRTREIEAGLHHAITTIQRRPNAKTAGTRVLSNQILRTLPEKARTLPAARELHALAV